MCVCHVLLKSYLLTYLLTYLITSPAMTKKFCHTNADARSLCGRYSADLHVPLHYKTYHKFWSSEELVCLKDNKQNNLTKYGKTLGDLESDQNTDYVTAINVTTGGNYVMSSKQRLGVMVMICMGHLLVNLATNSWDDGIRNLRKKAILTDVLADAVEIA